MKAIIKATSEQLFRSEAAKTLYNEMKNQTHVAEYGKDQQGNIYFHWLNGNTDRYTRKEFLKMANNEDVQYGYSL